MVIYLDTSAIYALLDANDKNHERARAAWAEWLSQPNQFITSNYVLLESSALIQHRLGIPAARAFYEEFVPVLQVQWVTADLHATAVKTVLAANRRDFSIVDAANIESMRRLSIRTIFAFDRHYVDQGLTQLP